MANTGTVELIRVFKAPPERVFRAFITAEALEKWLPPLGFTGRVLAMDARVGGQHRMHFTHFASGHAHAFGGHYLEVDAPHRLRYDTQFDDPGLPGQMVTTIDLRDVIGGTELRARQEGIPAVIPTSMCMLGWQESLDQLARLVEPDIPT